MPSYAKQKPFIPNRPRPQRMRGRALNPNAAIEARYYETLRRLIEEMIRGTHAELAKLFAAPPAEQYFAQDATVAEQAKVVMADLRARFEAIFDLASKPVATRMIAQESQSSAASLQTSLGAISGGLTIKTDFITGGVREVLQASVAENVGLIKSIPGEYFAQVSGAVMRSITTGNGLQDLVPFLRKYEGVTIRRARTIAADQTRKAFSNLNFARMKRVGIKQYEWLHSAGSQKPRKLHIAMSGKIYDLDKPPIIDEKTGQRGKPGDLINCRCRMVPIINFDDRT
jgi:SPP1 gp7 family putative phage head morphogenesis protein